LTKQLLAFSRRQPLRPESVDIAQQVRIVADLLGRSLRGDIAIVTDVPSELWPVQVDANQLELAMLNIGLNAAMPCRTEARSTSAPATSCSAESQPRSKGSS